MRVRFRCQQVIYSSLPAEDCSGSAASCRKAIQDDFLELHNVLLFPFRQTLSAAFGVANCDSVDTK